MAHSRYRKDRDTWVVDYRSNGRRVQASTDQDGNPFKSKTAADAYLRRVMAEQHGGAHVPRTEALRLEDLSSLYLDAEQERALHGGITPAVLANKRRDMEKVLAVLPRELRITELRARHVLTELVPALLKKGYTHKTVKEVVNTLRMATAWAANNDLVPINRLAEVRVHDPRRQEERLHMRDPALIEAILAAAPRYQDELYTVAYTGMRAGELRALAYSAIDFDADMIRVLRAVKPLIGIGPTKTGAGRRDIPLLPMLKARLLQRWLALPLPRDPDGLVFPASRSDAVDSIRDPGVWRDALEAGCRTTGSEKIGLHDLRDYFASVLIRQGFDKHRICELMGHGSIQVTERRYRHWFIDIERNRSDASKIQAAILKARRGR